MTSFNFQQTKIAAFRKSYSAHEEIFNFHFDRSFLRCDHYLFVAEYKFSLTLTFSCLSRKPIFSFSASISPRLIDVARLRTIPRGGMTPSSPSRDHCDVIGGGPLESTYETIGWLSGPGWRFCKSIFLGLGSTWGGTLDAESAGSVRDPKPLGFMTDEGAGSSSG